MSDMRVPESLAEAIDWVARGWSVYAEGIAQDNDPALLTLGAARLNIGLETAITYIKEGRTK